MRVVHFAAAFAVTLVGCADQDPLHISLSEESSLEKFESTTQKSTANSIATYKRLEKKSSAVIAGISVRTALTNDASELQSIRATAGRDTGITNAQLVRAILDFSPDWLPLKNPQLGLDGQASGSLPRGSNRIGSSDLLRWTWTNDATDNALSLRLEFQLL